jgi:hypothetical protein
MRKNMGGREDGEEEKEMGGREEDGKEEKMGEEEKKMGFDEN